MNFQSPFAGFAEPKPIKDENGIEGARMTFKHYTADGQKRAEMWGSLAVIVCFLWLTAGGGLVMGVIMAFPVFFIVRSMFKKTTVIEVFPYMLVIDGKAYDISQPHEYNWFPHPKSAMVQGTPRKYRKDGSVIEQVYDKAWLSCVLIEGQKVVMAELMDLDEAETLTRRVAGLVNNFNRKLKEIMAKESDFKGHFAPPPDEW